MVYISPNVVECPDPAKEKRRREKRRRVAPPRSARDTVICEALTLLATVLEAQDEEKLKLVRRILEEYQCR